MSYYKSAFRDSMPVLFGYIPLGISYGILFSTLRCPWYYATLSSLVIYAGAAQFLSVSLLAAHFGVVEIFTAILLLNIRHIFYGLSLLDRYESFKWKQYLIFGLTDETYSVLTSTPLKNKNDEKYCLTLTVLNHSYWIIGSTVGVLIGNLFHFDAKGCEFVLLALFTVLVIEQWYALKKPLPFVMGAVVSIFFLFIFPNQFLVLSILFTAILLALMAEAKSHA